MILYTSLILVHNKSSSISSPLPGYLAVYFDTTLQLLFCEKQQNITIHLAAHEIVDIIFEPHLQINRNGVDCNISLELNLQ